MPTPTFHQSDINMAVRATADDIVRRALTELRGTDTDTLADTLHTAASEAGLVAVAKSLEYTHQTKEVTAVREELGRLIDVLEKALADAAQRDPEPGSA